MKGPKRNHQFSRLEVIGSAIGYLGLFVILYLSLVLAQGIDSLLWSLLIALVLLTLASGLLLGISTHKDQDLCPVIDNRARVAAGRSVAYEGEIP